MAKRIERTPYGAIRTRAAEDAPDIIVSDVEDEDDTPGEVQAILKQLSDSGEYTLQIQKYNEDKAVWEIVKKMPLDQFNEEKVAEKFGGGQYKFIVRAPDGTFKQKINAAYATPLDEKGRQILPPDSGQKDMVLMLKEELASSRAKEQNLYQGMFGMMTELIKSNNAPKPSDNNGNFIDTYVKLRALDGKNPAAEITSVIDLIKTGMNMGKELGAATSDASPEDIIVRKLIDVAGNSLPNIIAALSKAAATKQAAPAPQAAPEAPAVQNADIIPMIPNIAPAAPERKTLMYIDELEKNVIESIKESKKDLIFAASSNIDINFVVNSILSKLDNESTADLFDYFSVNPDKFSREISEASLYRVLAFIPEFVPYTDWLKSLLKMVLIEINFEPLLEQGRVQPIVNAADISKEPASPAGSDK